MTDSRLLESVQRHWTKQIIGFQDLSYYDRLKSLSLFSVWGRLLRADLILVWKICSGQIPNLSHIFSFSHSSTRGHPLKIFVCRSSTEQRKRFFSNRVVKIWNNLSHSTVMSSSLSAFKLGLLDDLSELLYFYHDWTNTLSLWLFGGFVLLLSSGCLSFFLLVIWSCLFVFSLLVYFPLVLFPCCSTQFLF